MIRLPQSKVHLASKACSLVNVNILGILFPPRFPACYRFHLSGTLAISLHNASIFDDSQEFSISLRSSDLFFIITFVGHFPHG